MFLTLHLLFQLFTLLNSKLTLSDLQCLLLKVTPLDQLATQINSRLSHKIHVDSRPSLSLTAGNQIKSRRVDKR